MVMQIKVYLTDGGFVVSVDDCWLPGVYSESKAAFLATLVDDDELLRLWRAVMPAPLTATQIWPLIKTVQDFVNQVNQ